MWYYAGLHFQSCVFSDFNFLGAKWSSSTLLGSLKFLAQYLVMWIYCLSSICPNCTENMKLSCPKYRINPESRGQERWQYSKKLKLIVNAKLLHWPSVEIILAYYMQFKMIRVSANVFCEWISPNISNHLIIIYNNILSQRNGMTLHLLICGSLQ